MSIDRWLKCFIHVCCLLPACSQETCHGDTTARDVAQGFNLSGQVAVVTGGDSDLGFPVVLALAQQGATVVIASHNLSKCEALARRAAAATGGKVVAMALNLASFASVHTFVEQFLSAHDSRLHFLINNAGIAGNPPHMTADGFQMLFQINYLGPFLLTELLLPALRRSGRANSPAKVVNVASSEHEIACEAAGWPEGCLHDWTYLPPPAVPQKNVTIHYVDGGIEVRPVEIYGFTKVLAIEHAAELARRESALNTSVEAFSLTPGWVNTSLTRGINMSSPVAKRKCDAQKPNPCPFTPDQGAAITAFCALKASASGAYYSRISACQEHSVVSHGFSKQMASILYDRSRMWAGFGQQAGLVSFHI